MCHLDAGYLGYMAIKRELEKYLDPHGPNDPAIQPGLRNGALINSAITAAAKVPCPTGGYIDDGTLMTMLYDDIGFVNYVKLSFDLFGHNVQGFYYLYFILLFLSIVLFAAEFSDNLPAITILLCTMLGFFAEINSTIFTPFMPSVFGLRHSSTLAIIPIWHVAFLTLLNRRFSLLRVCKLLPQLALIAFAASIRRSADWGVIFLILLTVVLLVEQSLRLRKQQRRLNFKAGLLMSWPTLILLTSNIVYSVYINSQLHIVYFTDDVQAYHGLWDAAYQGFALSPRAAEMGVATAQGNYEAYKAGFSFARSDHFLSKEQSWVSPWTRTYKMRLYDNILKATVMEIWKKHPFDCIVLYVFYKPMELLRKYLILLSQLQGWVFLTGIAALVMAGSPGLLRVRDGFDRERWREFRVGALMAFFASIISASPNIWAYPDWHAMADFFVVATAAIGMLIAVGAYRAGFLIRRVMNNECRPALT